MYYSQVMLDTNPVPCIPGDCEAKSEGERGREGERKEEKASQPTWGSVFHGVKSGVLRVLWVHSLFMNLKQERAVIKVQ